MVHALIASLWLLAGATDDAKAAAEIDQQLSKLAVAPAPQISIVFDGITEKRYSLLSGSFDLDGEALPFSITNPSAPLLGGTLTAGLHHLDVKLSYKEAQGSGLFEYADYKLTMRSTIALIVEKGLKSTLHVIVVKHDAMSEKQRLSIASRVDSEMLGEIDDSAVPPLPGQLSLDGGAAKLDVTAEAKAAPNDFPARADGRPKSQPQHPREGDDSAGDTRAGRAAAAGGGGSGIAVADAKLNAGDGGSEGGLSDGGDAGLESGPVAPPAADVEVATDSGGDRRHLGWILLAAGMAIALLALYLSRRRR